MTRRALWIVLLGSVLTLAAMATWNLLRTGDGDQLPIYWDAPEFALVDQRGDTLRSTELRGTPWLVSFVFTNCSDVCPLITARMARIRDRLEARGRLGERARLVSITVDPARDSPAVLQRYAERFGGSPPSEWAFLTGHPPEAVRRTIQEGFRIAAVDPHPAATDTTDAYQVQHSPRILLVDPEGAVRAVYDATESGVADRIQDDLELLLEEG